MVLYFGVLAAAASVSILILHVLVTSLRRPIYRGLVASSGGAHVVLDEGLR